MKYIKYITNPTNWSGDLFKYNKWLLHYVISTPGYVTHIVDYIHTNPTKSAKPPSSPRSGFPSTQVGVSPPKKSKLSKSGPRKRWFWKCWPSIVVWQVNWAVYYVIYISVWVIKLMTAESLFASVNIFMFGFTRWFKKNVFLLHKIMFCVKAVSLISVLFLWNSGSFYFFAPWKILQNKRSVKEISTTLHYISFMDIYINESELPICWVCLL